MFGPGSASAAAWSTFPATTIVQCGSNNIASSGTVSAGAVNATSVATSTLSASALTTLGSDLVVGSNSGGAATNSVSIKCQNATGISSLLLTDGSANATMTFNPAYNKASLTANWVVLNATPAGSSIDVGTAIRVEGAAGTEIALLRSGHTRLTLDSGGIVRVGASGLATVPALQFVGNSGAEASFQYDEANDKIDVVNGGFNATGALTANTNLSITHDATNGGKIMTRNMTNLGIGTNGTAAALQISASGNVGVGKAPSVALDVNGDVSCSAVNGSALNISGDATLKKVLPLSNNTYSLGDASYRWSNTFTQDLDVAGMLTARTPVHLMLTGSPTIYLANGTTTPTTAPTTNSPLFFRYPTVSVIKNWGTVSYANTYGLKVPYEGLYAVSWTPFCSSAGAREHSISISNADPYNTQGNVLTYSFDGTGDIGSPLMCTVYLTANQPLYFVGYMQSGTNDFSNAARNMITISLLQRAT
jgi:hypothetical protein